MILCQCYCLWLLSGSVWSEYGQGKEPTQERGFSTDSMTYSTVVPPRSTLQKHTRQVHFPHLLTHSLFYTLSLLSLSLTHFYFLHTIHTLFHLHTHVYMCTHVHTHTHNGFDPAASVLILMEVLESNEGLSGWLGRSRQTSSLTMRRPIDFLLCSSKHSR